MKVLLDGAVVDPWIVDPAKHRYLGVFRPAENPLRKVPAGGCPLCPCGEVLQYQEQVRSHYLNGCCDMPQYVTIRAEAQ